MVETAEFQFKTVRAEVIQTRWGMVKVDEANLETIWIQELLASLRLLEHTFFFQKKNCWLWLQPFKRSSKHVAAQVRSVEGQFEHVRAQL